MAVADDAVFSMSPMFRLQWEEVQQRDVLLYPEGMVELNQSSAEILKLCDGTRTLEKIVTELEEKFSTSGLKSDVVEFIEVALEHGWIRQN
ncbi:MAG: pyrroloquinoline quinone biosynthesis peptide chaperone PqqD [Methylococcales bacterium]